MCIFLELLWVVILTGFFGFVGYVMLNISAGKNQEVTERIMSDVLIGMTAGVVVALITTEFDDIAENWLSFIFGLFILICTFIFIVGLISLIIVYSSGRVFR